MLVHLDELDFFLEQFDRLDIQVLLPGGGPQLGLLGSDIDDVLQVGRQFVVGVLVEKESALYRGLMDTGGENVLGDFVEAHRIVHGRGGEFGGIDNAALKRQIDLAAWQRGDGGAKAVHDVHIPAGGTDAHAFEILHFGGLLVGEEAHLLAAVTAGQGDEVELAVEFLHLLKTTALIQPDIVTFGVESKGNGTERNKVLVLALPVTRPVMTYFGGTFADCIK
ncbi:MAG: hypothetical protein ACD_75C02013G0001 [uncultured bacterium]|nr:MAG: hypothetical protein ACD_75C02013G0001 [uncultured bacterium]